MVSPVTSASSISVDSSFPFDHVVFPVCTRVDQDVRILNSRLQTATFLNLTFVGNDVSIHDNPLFSAAYFPELLSISGDLYIANNLQLLSANFMRVTRIDGSLSLINNNMLSSVVLSALTTIVGQLVYSGNPQLPLLVTPSLRCRSCLSPTCETIFTDILSCSVIVGNRDIIESAATSLVNPVLTRAVGDLTLIRNAELTRVDFASLSHIVGTLDLFFHNKLTRVDLPSLTFVGVNLKADSNRLLALFSVPQLTQVQQRIQFCANANTFVIPPGLTSVTLKGLGLCNLQQGSGFCEFVACP